MAFARAGGAGIAARGLDIEELPHVKGELRALPNVPEEITSVSWRTSTRGGHRHGQSLVCVDEHKHGCAIERLLKEIPSHRRLPSMSRIRPLKAEPIQNGAQQRGGGSWAQGQGRGSQVRDAAGQPRSQNNASRATPSGRRGAEMGQLRRQRYTSWRLLR